MVNIISEVNKYLAKKLTPYATIFQNTFQYQGSEEIICRQDPSDAVETRYLDGKRSGIVNFSYYAKSIDQRKAREQLDNIINSLDLANMTEITGGLYVSIEAVTLPSFISKTETGEYIFSTSFRLNYIGG
jgi:hypothetical protein